MKWQHPQKSCVVSFPYTGPQLQLVEYDLLRITTFTYIFSHTHFFCVIATVRFCTLLSREHILHMFHTQTNKQTMTHSKN